MNNSGYECQHCGYEPTEAELQYGICPHCKPLSKRQIHDIDITDCKGTPIYPCGACDVCVQTGRATPCED